MTRVFAAFFAAFLWLTPNLSEAGDISGTVDRLIGTAVATSDNMDRPLGRGAVIFVGDRVATGAKTRLRLRMINGATITLGDNSAIVIEATEREKGGSSILRSLQGVLLAVTAALTPSDKETMTIKTSEAVLGIRGTTVWLQQETGHIGAIMLSGSSVVVQSPLGTVELSTPLAGTDVFAGKPPTTPKQWGQKRIDKANRSVAFE
jgi:hypothetical protein